MSENILTHYPTFQPNQVLSDSQLNELRDYLDQQNRLTRTRLIGCGIVCGLHALIEDRPDGDKPVPDPVGQKNIRLSAGLAITSDGYLIEVESESVYAYYKVYEGTDDEGMRDWVCKDDPEKKISASARQVYELSVDAGEGYKPLTDQFVRDRVLILFWDRTVEDRKSCAVTDCSNKGANYKFVLRALLVSIDCLEPNPKCDTEKPKPIFIPRLFTAESLRYDADEPCPLATIDSTLEIREAYGSLAKRTAVILTECLTHLLKKLVNYEKKTVDDKTVYVWDSPDFLNVTYVQETIDKLYHSDNPHSIFAGAAQHYHQYHYDFVRDLTCAYNEFLEAWCLLVKNCSPCSGYRQHVMVREFVMGQSREAIDYRHWFEPAATRDAFHDKWHHVRALFLRIIKMIEAFDLVGVGSLRSLRNFPYIGITPSQSAIHGLGKQSLPFYYRLQDDEGNPTHIEKYWQPAECCTIDPLYSYHYFESVDNFRHRETWRGDPEIDQEGAYNYVGFGMHFDLQKHSQLRIEGHIGKDPRVVLPCIEGFVKDYNLDFDCLVLYLSETEPDLDLQEELRDDRGRDFFTFRTFKNFVKEYIGMEHCGGIGKGETFIIVVDPFCPGFDDDIVVADFTLPYRISCCLTDRQRVQPKLPYADSEGKITIDLRKPNQAVASGAYVYLVDNGVVTGTAGHQAAERVVPEDINPSDPSSWYKTFEGLQNGKRYDLYAYLPEGTGEGQTIQAEVFQKGLKADVRGEARVTTLGDPGPRLNITLNVVAPQGLTVAGTQVDISAAASGGVQTITLNDDSQAEQITFNDLDTFNEFYRIRALRSRIGDNPPLNGQIERVIATRDEDCVYTMYLEEGVAAASIGEPPSETGAISGIEVKATARTEVKTSTPAQSKSTASTSSTGKALSAEVFKERLEKAKSAAEKALPQVSAGTVTAANALLDGGDLKGGALTTAYLNAHEKIATGIKRSSKNQEKKNAYGKLLLPLTSVYLDRIVEQSPNALARPDAKAIESGVALLKEVNQLDRLVRSWDANALRGATGASVIDAIDKLIG